MKYEWDERKNARNLAKHGIRFEVAIEVFDDPNCIIEPSYDDPRTGEPRWIAVGNAPTYSAELVVIHVCYNERTKHEDEAEEIIRIISARKAHSGERRRFEGL